MRCETCGSNANEDDRYCYRCGTYLRPKIILTDTATKKPFINLLGGLFSVLGIMICLLVVFIYYFSNKGNMYLNDTIYTRANPELSDQFYGLYKTSIEYNTTYERKAISDLGNAKNLILQHSLAQKTKCQTGKVTNIENNIIDRHNIEAINLCEMDLGTAGNIEKILNETYAEFPEIKGYITNVTLMNPTINDTFMAAFIPIFQFANSKSNINNYPLVIKSMLILNSNYYLNYEYLNDVVLNAARVGYFPRNANGNSIFAHEMGHYISFVTLLKSYNLDNIIYVTRDNLNEIIEISEIINSGLFAKDIISEAYNNYRAKNPDYTYSETDFCATISDYAISSVYDETLAESYHDYYLNGQSASFASLEIINVLKNRLRG